MKKGAPLLTQRKRKEPSRDAAWWDDIKTQEVEKLLGVVERYAPGTRDKGSAKHNLPRAKVMHVEMVLHQMFSLRPIPELANYETPITHLFMANAGDSSNTAFPAPAGMSTIYASWPAHCS